MTDAPLICVIDDDISVRKALVGLLVSMGYLCLGFASAEQGLKSEHLEACDCIITDIHMPGMDGFAFKKLLDTRGVRTPVIMMTGHGDSSLELRVLESGALCLLRKPLHSDRLAEFLSCALGAKEAGRDKAK